MHGTVHRSMHRGGHGVRAGNGKGNFWFFNNNLRKRSARAIRLNARQPCFFRPMLLSWKLPGRPARINLAGEMERVLLP